MYARICAHSDNLYRICTAQRFPQTHHLQPLDVVNSYKMLTKLCTLNLVAC